MFLRHVIYVTHTYYLNVLSRRKNKLLSSENLSLVDHLGKYVSKNIREFYTDISKLIICMCDY